MSSQFAPMVCDACDEGRCDKCDGCVDIRDGTTYLCECGHRNPPGGTGARDE